MHKGRLTVSFQYKKLPPQNDCNVATEVLTSTSIIILFYVRVSIACVRVVFSDSFKKKIKRVLYIIIFNIECTNDECIHIRFKT